MFLTFFALWQETFEGVWASQTTPEWKHWNAGYFKPVKKCHRISFPLYCHYPRPTEKTEVGFSNLICEYRKWTDKKNTDYEKKFAEVWVGSYITVCGADWDII